MSDNHETNTRADSAGIVAEFQLRFADEFRGLSDRIRVMLAGDEPGDEPGTFRVFVCEDADTAAACLHRYWHGSKGRTL